MSSFKYVLLGSWLNVLLPAAVLGMVSPIVGFPDWVTFLANFVGIIPLAQLLGIATEEVSLYSNEVIGGLLNATLGNATELIISIFAIKAGLLRVVQLSLLGSILSNLLLVTGCAFLVGGLRFRMQHYLEKMASINSSLLKMAVLGLVIPSAYVVTIRSSCKRTCSVYGLEAISHATALVLFTVYMSLLFFQLRTHAYLTSEEAPQRAEPYLQLEAEVVDEADDEDEAQMTFTAAVLTLVGVTVCIALCSEYLVDTLEPAARAMNLTELFIGLVLLPIIGNAAEHATAVWMAYKGKTDLALGVALGSSVQIALGAIPALVLVAWVLNVPLTLDFGAFEAVIILVSTLVAASTLDFHATWLDGSMLIAAYVVVAIVYYFKKGTPPTPEDLSCICGDECCVTSI